MCWEDKIWKNPTTMFTWIRKLLTDLFYKPDTQKLSISRVAFVATLGICLFTAVTQSEVYAHLIVLLIALLPYLYLDKITTEYGYDRTHNNEEPTEENLSEDC